MKNKEYYKSLIGTKVIDKEMNREGYIKNIAFHSKDYSICWFNFKHNNGEYLIDIERIKVTVLKQLTLNL